MSCEDQERTSNIDSFPFWTPLNPEPGPDIFHDPRLRAVGWRDLVSVTSFEILWEPVLPAAWLVVSLVAAGYGHRTIALGFSFVFFLTGLRLIHNAFHSALGLSRHATDVVLWIMSLVMLGSMHAVQFNHLRHHRLALSEGDVEGRHANMPAWRALLFGPAFPFLLHVTALRDGNRKLRMTVVGELFLSAIWVVLVFRGFQEQCAPVPRGRYGFRAVPDGILRCVDSASPLRPYPLHRADAAQQNQERNYVQHVLAHRASSLSACANMSSAGALAPDRSRGT